MMFITFRSTRVLLSVCFYLPLFKNLFVCFMCFLCVHDVFWCVLCVWAKLPEIKLDDDDDTFFVNSVLVLHFASISHYCGTDGYTDLINRLTELIGY